MPSNQELRERFEEREFAINLANRVLDVPWSDPDDDLRTLARQFLREIERRQARVTPEQLEKLARRLAEANALRQKNDEWVLDEEDTAAILREELGGGTE